MKFKQIAIFMFMLLLVSCGNKGGQEYVRPVVDEEWDVQMEDSVKPEEIAAEEEEMKVPSATVAPSSVSQSHHSNYDDDNMRGFDPASEDDMEDNGMSRYMENNDEDGWD